MMFATAHRLAGQRLCNPARPFFAVYNVVRDYGCLPLVGLVALPYAEAPLTTVASLFLRYSGFLIHEDALDVIRSPSLSSMSFWHCVP